MARRMTIRMAILLRKINRATTFQKFFVDSFDIVFFTAVKVKKSKDLSGVYKLILNVNLAAILSVNSGR